MAEDLNVLRDTINQYLLCADYEGAGVAIAKAVPSLLELSVDEWIDVDDGATDDDVRLRTTGYNKHSTQHVNSTGANNAICSSQRRGSEKGESSSDSDGSSDSSDGSEEDHDHDDDNIAHITSYRYRSMLHHPRNPRLEHLCTWLYDTVVHPESSEEPEEQACQKLPAAILAAWLRLQLQQQQKQQLQQQQQQQQQPEQRQGQQGQGPEQQQQEQPQQQPTPEQPAPTPQPAARADGPQDPGDKCGDQGQGKADISAPEHPVQQPPTPNPLRLQPQQQLQHPQLPQLQPAAAATAPPPPPPPALPPTEALHQQHSAFSAPYCTWRHVAPDALPPLHDVLVGVLRVCWERHDDREPSRNIIWGAQSHSRRDDPVMAYLYVEYLRLLLASIIRSRAEPLWLWHELQEVIEEYPHWRHHPHEVAVLARMMVEHGCGWRLLNSLLDHIGKAPLLMYGTWAALWDGLRRSEARACARLASQYGVSLDAVWVHVAELTLLQVKEHSWDPKVLGRAVAVLSRVLVLTPAPAELAVLLRAERDAAGSCEGVRHVTSQLQLDVQQQPE